MSLSPKDQAAVAAAAKAGGATAAQGQSAINDANSVSTMSQVHVPTATTVVTPAAPITPPGASVAPVQAPARQGSTIPTADQGPKVTKGDTNFNGTLFNVELGNGHNWSGRASDEQEALKKAQSDTGYSYIPNNPAATDTTDAGAGTYNSTTFNGTDYEAADRAALQKANDDFQAQAKQVRQTILNIQSGATPLSAGEQAQVNGLASQFESLIGQQNLTNIGATGAASVRGYQTGSAEYDPTFAVKTIGSIASAGAAKVSDLQVKEASAIAQLTQSFKDSDIAAVKNAWSMYQDASKAKTDALQKTIDDTAKAMTDIVKSQQDSKRDNAIGELYTQGVKDPAVVVKLLKAQGIDSTAKDVQDSIKAFDNPPDIDTQVVEIGGQKLLINSKTGETVKNLGAATSGSGSSRGGTAAERSANALSSFAGAFVPGATMADGTPTVDPQGYITPKAWKAAIADAPAEGLTRKDFITQFGSMIYAPANKDGDIKVDSQYGLTPAEMKVITGA